MKITGALILSGLHSLRYLGILSALLVLGYFGHTTHWNFAQHARAEASHTKDHTPDTKHPKPDTTRAIVEFPNATSVQKSGIDTAAVETRSLQERVRATGVITYDQRLSAGLSSRVSGTVWRVTKHTGDSVRKGDVLIVVDAAEVGRIKTELLSALVGVESKTEILTNLEKNKVIGVTPDRMVREARIALREAQLQLLNAEQTLINFGLSVRASDLAQLDDAARAAKLQFLGLPSEIIAELDPGRTTSNLLPVAAPFDGVLIGHEAVLGEIVAAGNPIMEIANVGRMWLKLNVPKEDGLKIVLGQSVSFKPDGMDVELASRISWISTAVDEQTRTLQVRAEVENPLVSTEPQSHREVHLLRANAFGTGTIMVREAPRALTVPATSLIETEDGSMVFVRTGDRSFRRCEVIVGIRNAEFVQLLSGGLQPGQHVVTRGNHVLKSELALNQLASSGP